MSKARLSGSFATPKGPASAPTMSDFYIQGLHSEYLIREAEAVRARLVVCCFADSVSDAGLLLSMLGLI